MKEQGIKEKFEFGGGTSLEFDGDDDGVWLRMKADYILMGIGIIRPDIIYKLGKYFSRIARIMKYEPSIKDESNK